MVFTMCIEKFSHSLAWAVWLRDGGNKFECPLSHSSAWRSQAAAAAADPAVTFLFRAVSLALVASCCTGYGAAAYFAAAAAAAASSSSESLPQGPQGILHHSSSLE